MINGKKIVCVIPARLESTRFPRKILALLGGKPLLQWAWDAAIQVSFVDEVVFAIDSEETAQIIEVFGGKYFMTSIDCLRGTDRLVELQQRDLIQGDIWINWQADEPFISEKMLQDLLISSSGSQADVWTLKVAMQEESVRDPSLCKVVCDEAGFALYFSRSPIPYYREDLKIEKKYFRHVGMYAYSNEALQKIAQMKPSEIECAESLEQLRFLSYGLKIQVNETEEETIGVDFPEHLALAEAYISTRLSPL
ncbi:MAG: 3-deoxy-manno-octulosonate cytidylyltransferase [Rhabdochlamydiaceae bacterium]|nr:3-deoxy-manno-octulosonate cytidylyltransferase [Rhabdochlamydiaceae bacterium]